MVKALFFSNDNSKRSKSLKGNKKSISYVNIGRGDKGKTKKKNIMDFFGIWKDDEKYWNDYNKEIRKIRNYSKKDFLNTGINIEVW